MMESNILEQNLIHEGNLKISKFMDAIIINDYPDKEHPENSHVLLDYGGDEKSKKENYPDDWTRYHSSMGLKYHKSFDWIMKVIIKIEKLGFNIHNHQARTLIERNDIVLLNQFEEPEIEIRSSIVDFNKLISLWTAVIQFIDWHNKIYRRN